jgi:hypothetical protein
MSETVVPVDAAPSAPVSLDAGTLLTVVGYLQKGLAAAEFIAHMTGKAATEAEIKLIEGYVAKVQPYLADPSVANVINILLSLFQKGGVAAVEAQLKALVG